MGPTTSIIVRTRAGLSPGKQADVIARNGGVETSAIPVLRLHVVDVPADQVGQYLNAYQSDPGVESAERDRTRDAEGAPDDTAFGQQWALPQIGWDQAYGNVTPSGSATVAVLDTGVQSSDVSLTASGFSAFGGDPSIDPNGHGTWLASIAAATTNNGAGIAGIAYDGVDVMPVQVLDADGLGQDSDIIAGVVYAADHGADVILMGFSNPGFSAALQAAVDYAWSQGAVLVAATGNDGSSTPTYPAGDAKVIGVSATDQGDALWGGSNYGADTFIAAPGVGIEADAVGGGTTSVTGTSASAAIVAGAAALLEAADPGASNSVIIGRLARNADPAGTSDQTGNGRLNIGRALGAPDGGQLAGSSGTSALDVTAVYDPSTTTITATITDANANKFYNIIYTPPAGGGSEIRRDCLAPDGNGGNVTFTNSLVIPAGFPTGVWTITVDEINSGRGCAGPPNREATTTITATISAATISGFVVNDLDGNGVDNSESGIGEVTITLFGDTGNGTFDGSPTDPQIATTMSAVTTGIFSLSSLAVGTYFVVETDPNGFTSTAAIAGTGAGTTSTVETNNRIKIVISTSGSTSSGNTFLDTDGLPSITVTTTADPPSLGEPGGDFTFSVNVHNDSNVDTVTLESLTDDLYGDLDGLGTCSVPQTITPDADYGCSFTGSFLGEAGDSQTDTVTASGTDDDNAPVSQTGAATVSITDVASMNPVVIIFMENSSSSEVLGNANAPYLNSFYDGGRAFTNYREGDSTGPSLPDYLQIAAGSSCGAVDNSVVPGKFGSAEGCSTTVWNQLEGVGATWGVYMDAMPTACSSEVTYDNAALDTPYALRHNPATPFASIWSDPTLCTAHVLPYTSFRTTNMPAVSFIAPGICNDQHGTTKVQADGTPLYQDCYPDSAEVMRRGDDWLAARVPAMLAAGATVFITYDERGVLYAAEQGPGIPAGVTDSTAYTHYSLLAAIEARFGLAKLGGAQTAKVIPI